MILFASVIVLAFVIGFLAGGRPSGFEGVHVRWWGLAIVGLAVQFIPLPEGEGGTDLLVRTIVLAISYGLLLTFAIRNVRLPGLALILVGLAMNTAVIVANGGMPVSADALRSSDQTEVLQDLEQAGADKHHLETEDDVLTPLGDVIGIPPPVAQAVSVGDILVYAGLMWFVISAMRGRIRPTDSPALGYRGKHRSAGASSASPGRHAPGLPAATTSGTEP